jgi:hypothetical protein
MEVIELDPVLEDMETYGFSKGRDCSTRASVFPKTPFVSMFSSTGSSSMTSMFRLSQIE